MKEKNMLGENTEFTLLPWDGSRVMYWYSWISL